MPGDEKPRPSADQYALQFSSRQKLTRLWSPGLFLPSNLKAGMQEECLYPAH
jgi:hypothetical protein